MCARLQKFTDDESKSMLLITRRTGEGIVINGSIEVKVLDIRGGRVKLGFEYPLGNSVYRQEVFAKIQEENRAAVQTISAPSPQNSVFSEDAAKIGTVLASVGKPHTKAQQKDVYNNEPNRTNPGNSTGASSNKSGD